MSQSGYPYPQGTNSGSTPPQSRPPHSGAPYPTNPPPYPTHGGVTTPNLGFNVDMPQPYAGVSYPSSASGESYMSSLTYPSAQQGYPPSQPAYLPSQTPYPSTQPPSSISHAPLSSPPFHQPSSSYPGQQTTQGQPYPHSNSGGHSKGVKSSPTVVPVQEFNPGQDAEALRKAMKGLGTDEKTIINVLTKRSNAQRLEIAVQFKTLYSKDLIKELKSELDGNLKNTIVALMTPLPQFYAKELHDAIWGLGTYEDVLIEMMCTLTNAEIRTIRETYQKMYHRNLESDLKGDTSGHFRRLMVARDESMVTDQQKAAADAQALYNAEEKIWGTDESVFNVILCQRNYAQLGLIFQEYKRISGHDLEEGIKSQFSGNIQEGLLSVVHSIKNKHAFFAERLHKSMKGLGTHDRDLIRLVVTRCEIDMGDIKKEYKANHKESLGDAIKGDCSGDYRKCLLALIGEA